MWHDVVRINGNLRHVLRVFFWDDDREFTGVRIFKPDDKSHVRSVRDFIRKLVADSRLRTKYERELRFPLERNYCEYGAFPEEISD